MKKYTLWIMNDGNGVGVEVTPHGDLDFYWGLAQAVARIGHIDLTDAFAYVEVTDPPASVWQDEIRLDVAVPRVRRVRRRSGWRLWGSRRGGAS